MVNCGIKILKGEVKESLDTGKISPLLYKQLMCLYLNGLFSPDFVLREIRYLEGIDTNKTTTNTHKFFKNKPLLGLCKKHFFAPHNIENNFTTILSKNNVEIFLKNKFNIDVAKTDFSKYKLAKAFIRWSRDHSLSDLQSHEIEQAEQIIIKINKALQ